MSSGSLFLLKITSKLSMNWKNIWRRVVSTFLFNTSPSFFFLKIALQEKFPQNCQAVFAATGMNGTVHWLWVQIWLENLMWIDFSSGGPACGGKVRHLWMEAMGGNLYIEMLEGSIFIYELTVHSQSWDCRILLRWYFCYCTSLTLS